MDKMMFVEIGMGIDLHGQRGLNEDQGGQYSVDVPEKAVRD